MKKQLLITSLFLFSLFAMSQGPVAVDDSASLKLGEYVTVNVTQNDFHPDGFSFRILNAYNAYSFTDSTITYFADYENYFSIDVDFVYDYNLIKRIPRGSASGYRGKFENLKVFMTF